MRLNNAVIILIVITTLISCKEEALPKPNAMLRLEYQQGDKKNIETANYEFQINELAETQEGDSASLTIDYPSMKGSIFVTYKQVDNNLENLLSDAQKLSYEHVVKADNIIEQPFINEEDRVYGMYYEVRGDAASQAQFYLTDSLNHFVTGSLYFYARPNYDSIYPASIYLQRDIRHIMESLNWKK